MIMSIILSMVEHTTPGSVIQTLTTTWNLWNTIKTFDRDQLVEYYEEPGLSENT